jgi:hypothetical protein
MHTKMPTGRYLHGAHGAPYCDKTLNLLPLSLTLFILDASVQEATTYDFQIEPPPFIHLFLCWF